MLNPVQLGNSGLQVSQLCLGTMNFGVPGQGHQGDWTLGIDESREIFRTKLGADLTPGFVCFVPQAVLTPDRLSGRRLRRLEYA
jgi:hypothetical protein